MVYPGTPLPSPILEVKILGFNDLAFHRLCKFLILKDLSGKILQTRDLECRNAGL